MAINNVWELVDCPQGANLVSCKWVFKVKRLPNGDINKFNARLVARGFSQRYGVGYDETFAPVVHMESLRVLLTIAAMEDLEAHQLDVVTAYLAGELEEEIYMTSPQGLPNIANKVCRLLRGLYGLKQSARVWNRRIGAVLKRLGLTAIATDALIWVNKDYSVILALYVDDIVLFARQTQSLESVKAALSKAFNMKYLGPISTVLGMRVRCDRVRRMLWIDQSHYIQDILKEFRYTDCRPVATPADGYAQLRPGTPENDPSNEPFPDIRLYQRALGCLNWLVRGTRPDIAFVVHKLSQFCHQPCRQHWRGVLRVLRYLKHSPTLAIRYGPSTDGLVGYTDTDYAADILERPRHWITGRQSRRIHNGDSQETYKPRPTKDMAAKQRYRHKHTQGNPLGKPTWPRNGYAGRQGGLDRAQEDTPTRRQRKGTKPIG
jgi:hypothetical protein